MGCRCLQTIIDNESNDFNYFFRNRYTKNKIGADGSGNCHFRDNEKKTQVMGKL
jgi:hypothetical protein